MQSSDCLRRYWLSTAYFMLGILQLASVVSQLTSVWGQVLIDIDLAITVFGVMCLEHCASPKNIILQPLANRTTMVRERCGPLSSPLRSRR